MIVVQGRSCVEVVLFQVVVKGNVEVIGEEIGMESIEFVKTIVRVVLRGVKGPCTRVRVLVRQI